MPTDRLFGLKGSVLHEIFIYYTCLDCVFANLSFCEISVVVTVSVSSRLSSGYGICHSFIIYGGIYDYCAKYFYWFSCLRCLDVLVVFGLAFALLYFRNLFVIN